MLSITRESWNADFAVDTNVINHALDDSEYCRTLVDLLTRMAEHGKCWFAMTSFVELIQTSDSSRRTKLLEKLLHICTRLGDRISFFSHLKLAIEYEWASSPMTPPALSSSDLASDIHSAIKTGSLKGTNLEEFKVAKLDWIKNQKPVYKSQTQNGRAAYQANPDFRATVNFALKNFHPPIAHKFCEDVVTPILEELGLPYPDAITQALNKPHRYPTTWTFALLVRLSHIAQTIPDDTKEREFREYGNTLKFRHNDIVDATIAAVSASCGIMITEDECLRARLNFLHDRRLGRTRGFALNFLANNWYPQDRNSE